MAETGKIVVQVYTGRRAFPVSGACISMLGRSEDGSRSLEAFRRSGPDGYTKTVELDAPDASVSLDENSSAMAYSTVDILVDSLGYYTAFVEGVQIYPGHLSRQEIEMIPLPESIQEAGEGGSVTYYIPPQRL